MTKVRDTFGRVAYEVRTEAFSGPLDVLVKLIVSQEVDVWEVSLARLVDDFVAVLADVGRDADTGGESGVDLDGITEFAVLAATLIELKSRRLLPSPSVELDLEEELAPYGRRDEVLARLLEGRTFAAAARLLREHWAAASLQWPRTAGPEERFSTAVPDLLERATASDLVAAMERVLAPRPVPKVDLRHLRSAGITVDEAASHIAEQLAECGTATFRELTIHLDERIVVVVHFLAVLELFNSGLVELTQAERFGDIGVVWIAGDDAVLPTTAGTYGEDAA